MPQIQGVQGRRPYAAARQQPTTCELWHALVYTSAGDWGILLFVRTAAFLKGGESRPLVVILLKKKLLAFSRKPKLRKKNFVLKLIIAVDIN